MRQNASGTTILTDHLNIPTYIKCRVLLNDMCYTMTKNIHFGRYSQKLYQNQSSIAPAALGQNTLP